MRWDEMIDGESGGSSYIFLLLYCVCHKLRYRIIVNSDVEDDDDDDDSCYDDSCYD